jgi:hypothetical protein
MMHIISLGAGVQSSTMALMAASGEITPMPDCAIFADTGAEPKHVYEQLEYIKEHVPFPVYTVMEDEGLEKSILDSLDQGKDRKGRFTSAPFYTESSRGLGMLRRQCTKEFKLVPIQQKIRELMGLKKGQHGPKEVGVTQWIGISMDEAHRMKPSLIKWIENAWPLIDMGIHRYQCLQWMEKNGHPLPKKSACYFCPYHDDATWQDMKENDPDSWEKTVKMDGLIRKGVHGTTEKLYLHDSMMPISETDLVPNRDQVDMFGNECEGMCGV